MEFNHYSVMLKEVIDNLNVKDDGIYVDGTTGGAGHSYEIAKRLGANGKLICFDQDIDAINVAKERLKEFGNKIIFVNENFEEYERALKELEIKKVDGILLDLGVSSYQIDTPIRGFSYMHDANLDMRMDVTSSLTAKYVVNEYPTEKLEEIFYKYGEEKWTKKIVSAIDKYRNDKQIETTLELVNVIKTAIPPKFRYSNRGHFAKRVFQALRIEVNNELGVIENTIPLMIDSLNKKGRFCIITFHSLEDKIVKSIFKEYATGCICPKELPICVCKRERIVKFVSRKPILPTDEELLINSRSKSAKLRVIQKL